MCKKQERLYMLYFYNSVIEFIYFIILYIEVCGATSLKTLCKHVKFFKTEVATLILSFDGKSFEDKLCQMLRTFDCFVILDDKISILKNNFVKDAILEDLIIGKSVDLVLRGIDNISEICDNLKVNNVIFIQEENIIDMFERSNYISIKDKQVLTLNHVHALLGFDDHLSNSVISYFHNILCYETVLSFNDVKNHCRFLSICGIHNVLVLFSILHCSNHFVLEDGFIVLKKKSKKYPKLKPISVDLLHDRFSSRALSIGQIIHSTYGSFLHKWIGEIGSLSINSGVVYCVVDFTNGFQGIFNVYFNETALKVVSEIDDIKKYLKIRDRVQFDAEYYNGKNLDRCWRATRLKVLHENKLEYNEELFDKLCYESELLRNRCTINNHCLVTSNVTSPNSVVSYSLKDKNLNSCDEILLKNDMVSVNDSVDKLIISEKGMQHCTMSEYKTPRTFYSSFSNLLILDYSLMFGFIYMLMEDKGFAIAKFGSKFYNILFMKNSVYTQNGTTDLMRGQKILALIPHYNELEAFCISTFIYGLNYLEFNETEKNDVSPDEFALKFFKKEETGLLKCKFCSKLSVLEGLLGRRDRAFNIGFKQKLQLIQLCDQISGLYKTPFKKDCFLQFLSAVCKIDSMEENICKSVLHFLIQLSRCFTKLNARKHNKEMKKRPLNTVKQSILQNRTTHTVKNSLEESSSSDCNMLPLCMSPNSVESLNSFKTCHSFDLIENSQNKIEFEEIFIDNVHNSTEGKSSTSSCISPIYITLSGAEDLNSLKTCQSVDSIENSQTDFQNLSFGDNLGNLIKDRSDSDYYLSPSPLRKSPSSSESLNSFKTCHSSDSAENFYSCESDSLTPDHSSVSFQSMNEIQTSDDILIQTKESTSFTPDRSSVSLQPADQISCSDDKLLSKTTESTRLTPDHSSVSLQSADQIPSSDDKLLSKTTESTRLTPDDSSVSLQSADQIPSSEDKLLVKTTESTCLTPDHLSVSLQAIDQTLTSENILTEAKQSTSLTPNHPSVSLMSLDLVPTSDDTLNQTEKSTGLTLHRPFAFLQPIDQITDIPIHSLESTSLMSDHSSISLQSVDQIPTSDNVLVQTKASTGSFTQDHSIKSLQSIDHSPTSDQKAIESKESTSFIPDHSCNPLQFVNQGPTFHKFVEAKASDKMKYFQEIVNEPKFEPIQESLKDSNTKSKCKKLHQLRSVCQSKYLYLKSLPLLKHCVKKKRSILLHNGKSVCRNCTRSPVTISANLSLISSSFFCYTMKLNGYEVTLPLPKQTVPDDVQECLKLNSCCELTVVPNVIFNLSHIIKVNIHN